MAEALRIIHTRVVHRLVQRRRKDRVLLQVAVQIDHIAAVQPVLVGVQPVGKDDLLADLLRKGVQQRLGVVAHVLCAVFHTDTALSEVLFTRHAHAPHQGLPRLHHDLAVRVACFHRRTRRLLADHVR